MPRFPAVITANQQVPYGKRAVGRPRGSKNKRTHRLVRAGADLAREYAPEAIETLAKIMRGQTGTRQHPTPEATRVSACNSILDRALGRPAETADVSVMQAMDIVYRSPAEILEEIKRRQLQPVLELAVQRIEDDDEKRRPGMRKS